MVVVMVVVVMLMMLQVLGLDKMCAGTLLQDSWILTAGHCVHYCRQGALPNCSDPIPVQDITFKVTTSPPHECNVRPSLLLTSVPLPRWCWVSTTCWSTPRTPVSWPDATPPRCSFIQTSPMCSGSHINISESLALTIHLSSTSGSEMTDSWNLNPPTT